jgi:hypothetical protein
MTNEELNKNLKVLVDCYVKDPAERLSLMDLVDEVSIHGKGVKGVLARLDKWANGVNTPAHAKLIKDIYFNYC